MTHLHTLGWTGDNGPNLFAVGWLALLTIEIVPKGGMDEDLVIRKRSVDDENFITLLMLFIAYIENDE